MGNLDEDDDDDGGHDDGSEWVLRRTPSSVLDDAGSPRT